MLLRIPITISLEQLRNSGCSEKCTKKKNHRKTARERRSIVWKKAMKKPARNRSLKKKVL